MELPADKGVVALVSLCSSSFVGKTTVHPVHVLGDVNVALQRVQQVAANWPIGSLGADPELPDTGPMNLQVVDGNLLLGTDRRGDPAELLGVDLEHTPELIASV